VWRKMSSTARATSREEAVSGTIGPPSLPLCSRYCFSLHRSPRRLANQFMALPGSGGTCSTKGTLVTSPGRTLSRCRRCTRQPVGRGNAPRAGPPVLSPRELHCKNQGAQIANARSWSCPRRMLRQDQHPSPRANSGLYCWTSASRRNSFTHLNPFCLLLLAAEPW
jgi:hypothetical protein